MLRFEIKTDAILLKNGGTSELENVLFLPAIIFVVESIIKIGPGWELSVQFLYTKHLYIV